MIRNALYHFGRFLERYAGIIGPVIVLIPIFFLTTHAWRNGYPGYVSMISDWIFGG